MRTDKCFYLYTFFRQSSISCAILHSWTGLRTHYLLPSDSSTWGGRSGGKRERGEAETGSAARICKITEPHCQGFVSVFVIQWLRRSLCVWLRSNGMLTWPWSCLSNIISLDKRSERGASSVPLKAILPYIREPGAREMLTVDTWKPIS